MQQNNEPTLESIKHLQEKCYKDFKVKISEKDTIIILKNAKKAKESEDLMDTALHSSLHLSKDEISNFRNVYEKNYGSTKDYSDFEMNELARKISVIAVLQTQRETGKKILANIIKYLKVTITKQDKEKLKKLFKLAFNIKLTESQTKYYLKLSHWFTWYEEGLDYNLSKALDNLLIHYDKKKRGKKGSLQPKDYDLGDLYRWIEYSLNKLKNDKTLVNKNKTPMSLKIFLKWIDNDFQQIQSFLQGDKYTQDKNGKFTIKMNLKPYE